MSGPGQLFLTVMLGQAAGQPSPLFTSLVVLAAVAVALTGLLYWRLQHSQQALAQVRTELQAVNAELKEVRGKVKQQDKKLTKRNEEIQALKKDLAGLRKKHHDTQETSKSLRAALKESEKERQKSHSERPAFSEAQSTKQADAAPQTAAPVRPLPAERQAPPANENAELKALAARLAELEGRLQSEVEDKKKLKAEQREMRRKVEQYRRVDIITKNQAELLHDKLRTLGRQYYDAISELAVLKGEVAPPKPKDEAVPSAFNDEADSTPEPEAELREDGRANLSADSTRVPKEQHVDSSAVS